MNKPMSIGLRIENRKVRECFSDVLSAFGELALQEFAPGRAYDLLILEIGEDLEGDFDLVHAIQASGLVHDIFLTSTRMEPEFLIRALRAGIREFIPQPVSREDVTAAIGKLLKKLQQKDTAEAGAVKKGKMIYLMGSKGGVGTTTIAVNLAANLVKHSPTPASVALVDMNFLLGEVPIFLNLKPEFGWGKIARNVSRLDAHYLISTLSRHSSGVYVLPAPIGLEGMEVSTPELIERILGVMKPIFDFIVIDGGQSLDDLSLKIMEMTDYLCVIAILSLPCLTNVKRILRTFDTLGYPRQAQIKIVINRFHKNSLIALKDVEAALNRKISGLIDNDYPNTMSAINQGKILEVIAPGAEVTKNIKALASGFLEPRKG
ncbi:MAG: AAA family ATPase [Thermodesulfobacteriota bacterium]